MVDVLVDVAGSHLVVDPELHGDFKTPEDCFCCKVVDVLCDACHWALYASIEAEGYTPCVCDGEDGIPHMPGAGMCYEGEAAAQLDKEYRQVEKEHS